MSRALGWAVFVALALGPSAGVAQDAGAQSRGAASVRAEPPARRMRQLAHPLPLGEGRGEGILTLTPCPSPKGEGDSPTSLFDSPCVASTASGTHSGATAGAAGEPRKQVAEVLASRRYEFCHSPQYPLTRSEKEWCQLGANANPACPALAEACQREATAKQADMDEPLTFRLRALPMPIRYLLWALLGVAVAMLVFALVRHFLDHQPKAVVATAAPSTADAEATAALARQVETDVQRLLERARQEAAAGDFRAAIGSVYAALLRRLEGSGVIRVEPDQTNGDYLGTVKRERPQIGARMAEVVDGVELAQFGEAAVTREHFDGLWLRVTSLLSERIGVLLLIVGLLGGGACRPPRGDWEHSPSGRAGVIAFLGKRGFTVRERLTSVTKIGKVGETKAGPRADREQGAEEGSSDQPDELKPALATGTQLVLLPGAQLGDKEWQALRAWIAQGGRSLVVAGGKRMLPDWIGMRVVEKPGAATPITPADTAAKTWGALQVRVPEANVVEGPPESQALLRRGASAYARERWVGEPPAIDKRTSNNDDEPVAESRPVSRVVVLADDSLLRNAGLLVADNAAALDALLRDGGTAVELIGDLTGLVSANPIQSVHRGRLGPALLQLLGLLVLFFVCKGARFGRPLPSVRVPGREFAEHVQALGLHYARAHADRVALAALGAYAIDRLRERFGLHVDRSLSGLAEAVAARTGRPVGDLMRMFLEARDAGKGVPADKDARDLDTASQMCRLLEETGGTGGHQRIPGNV